MKYNKLFFFFCFCVLAGYLIYGIFYLYIPPVKGDDMWEISRAHFLLKYHHQGDPMFPVEISPYMNSLFSATGGSKYFGIIKTASQAFFIGVLPIDDIAAFRVTSFAWSLLVCVLTFWFGRKIGLHKIVSFVTVVLLIMVPEFFSQLHSQRPELMITASYLLGLMFFIYALEVQSSWKKKLLLLFSGAYGWLTVIAIHPNAIMIPATFGCIYLCREYKNFISINTLLFAISMIAGFLFFYHIMHAAATQAVLAGGGDLLDVTGPPILRRGVRVIISLPVIFYHKFSSVNMFARPVSLLFFLASCVSFYYLIKTKSVSALRQYFDILIIGIITPIILLPLISASNGHYNIIVFPLCAVLIAAALNEFSAGFSLKNKFINILAAMLCLVFLTNFPGVKKQQEYAENFQQIRSELRNIIRDNNATIIGSGLFYLDFKNQNYYSSSAMSPRIGKPAQSFENATMAVQAKFLIIDDGMVYRLNRVRQKPWMDDMFNFLDTKCELISEIDSKYWLGHSEGTSAFPSQWRYEGQDGNFLKKIKIYRVVNS